MNVTLLVIGSVVILLAAAFHVYVFVLESVTWRTPKTWKTFWLSARS